jgi:RNA polymerase sigma-70 factor (ECF subfamily)
MPTRVEDQLRLVDQDEGLLLGLRDRDEEAFVELLHRHGGGMLRVARTYARNDSVAEEIVQETWLNVLKGVDRFEGRSSLRTWIFAILANCALKRLEKEGQLVSINSLADENDEGVGLDERFFPATHPRWAGMWSTLVTSWDRVPDEELLGSEARNRLQTVLKSLPSRQATVFVLRDVEGWPSKEVSDLLDVSTENQRVLLHRARAQVRASMEIYFAQTH